MAVRRGPAREARAVIFPRCPQSVAIPGWPSIVVAFIKISAGCRRPPGHRRDAGPEFPRFPGRHAGRLHRRRRVLRDLGLPDHGHHHARAGTRPFQPDRLLQQAYPAHLPGTDRGARRDIDAGLVLDVAAGLCATRQRRFRQRGFSGQYRAAAAVRLFRRRIRQKAAAAFVVARHRGAVLSVLAAAVDARRPAAVQHFRGGRDPWHRVFPAQCGADRLRPRRDLLSAVHAGVRIARRRGAGLRLAQDRQGRRGGQLARFDRRGADCAGGGPSG